jgi:hypothetical protein
MGTMFDTAMERGAPGRSKTLAVGRRYFIGRPLHATFEVLFATERNYFVRWVDGPHEGRELMLMRGGSVECDCVERHPPVERWSFVVVTPTGSSQLVSADTEEKAIRYHESYARVPGLSVSEVLYTSYSVNPPREVK